MTCVKTGADIYIIPYGLFAHCDAFEVADVTYFRISHTAPTPTAHVLHYEVNNFENWWGRETERYSTLICENKDVQFYGYDGAPLSQFDFITGDEA